MPAPTTPAGKKKPVILPKKKKTVALGTNSYYGVSPDKHKFTPIRGVEFPSSWLAIEKISNQIKKLKTLAKKNK